MIFLTGGSGFVGSAVLSVLVEKGRKVKVLVRNKVLSSENSNPTLIDKFQGNVLDPVSLKKGMEGCTYVINCVGIILETKTQTFQKMHVEAVKNLVDAAKSNGVEKIIHISALGTSDKPVSEYFRTKYEGEQIIKSSGLKYTIFRPSLVFGKGEKFFPVLKKLVKLPLTPVIGSGKNRFQPVFIEDLAYCVCACVSDEKTDDHTFEIGGPQIFTFFDMLDVVSQVLKKKFYPIHIPVSLVRIFASIFEKILREPPITCDQLRMLKVDNITPHNAAKDFFKLELKDLKTGLSSYLRD
ncbi:complex I NDUFA9 subunit family protein [bacterium]|nr:complex I NDUFA9 subunit family protein [bacterium]